MGRRNLVFHREKKGLKHLILPEMHCKANLFLPIMTPPPLMKTSVTFFLNTPKVGLCKKQKSSLLILSRVNPGCIFYVDFRNIKNFKIGCHLPCPLFSLNWLLTPL